MADATIICHNCNTEIKLTESLAAPLLASTRQQYEKQLAQKDADIAKREDATREKEKKLTEEKRLIETHVADQVAAHLKGERQRVVAEEGAKARSAAAEELAGKSRDLEDLQVRMKQNDAKLAEAQKAQADLLRKQRELEDAKRELDLTIERRVQTGLAEVRSKARTDAEEGMRLKVAEKDMAIASMKKQIDELKQKAEQGSQQLQGEVQELDLESRLRAKFPFDLIEPVAKGEFGGDALHRVHSSGGIASGTILWESKRTRNWSDGWLGKLRDDQRSAKADVCVLVSQVLPKGVDAFDLVEGVWVASPQTALPVALMLRQGLLEVTQTRALAVGQQTKAEMVYQYLTGPRFKQRVEAIVEAFSSMQDDLDKERKVITRQWAKRQQQIERVMDATVGMYGDMQGIAGKSLQEIEGLELAALDGPSEGAEPE